MGGFRAGERERQFLTAATNDAGTGTVYDTTGLANQVRGFRVAWGEAANEAGTVLAGVCQLILQVNTHLWTAADIVKEETITGSSEEEATGPTGPTEVF